MGVLTPCRRCGERFQRHRLPGGGRSTAMLCGSCRCGTAGPPRPEVRTTCVLDGCEERAWWDEFDGLCYAHHRRVQVHGAPYPELPLGAFSLPTPGWWPKVVP